MAKPTADLERRARSYAALGDPGRLSVVDALALGDLSPGDLARRLGIASNLLAHHLRVLEDAGLVARARSEGDRRRSYVRLRTEHPALASLAPALDDHLRDRRRVVFVCTHNSARSQLAASAWRHVSSVPATSAGTRPAPRVHPGALGTAQRHGLDLADAETRHVDDVLEGHDLVVAVCDQVHEELGQVPRLHWSVPDPVRSATPDDFEAAYVDLAHRVGRLAAGLRPEPA